MSERSRGRQVKLLPVRWTVTVLLACCYGAVRTVAALPRFARPQPGHRRVLATATFFNVGWYRAHIVPFVHGVADEVILVTDAVVEPTPGVRYCCPPRWVAHVIGRAAAKFVWGLAAAIRWRPDWCVGYHLFPGAISALIIARLVGRPACYQMTGGPVEVIGGGYAAENRLLRQLGRPSALVERWALCVVRCFDLVVVRGAKARRFLESSGVTCPVVIIPGAVDCDPAMIRQNRGEAGHRDSASDAAVCIGEQCRLLREKDGGRLRARYDMVFVGRLAPMKQPEQFIHIVNAVSRLIPGATAAVVGDGPMDRDLRALSVELGLDDRIDFLGAIADVGPILARSHVFVLTSRSEGLSIAMLEAMVAGLPPVVADVGELSEAVQSGQSGWLITPDAVDEFASRIVRLLEDEALYRRMSAAAREHVTRLASTPAVCESWRVGLGAMFDRIPARLGVGGRWQNGPGRN